MAAVTPRPADELPTGDVTLTGGVLHLTGETDAAARAFLRSGPPLQQVTAVDMTQAHHAGEDTYHLLARCLQQTLTHHPGTRLQLTGADDDTRWHLDRLGITTWLDLSD